MHKYIADRIPTARLLEQASWACQADEKDYMRASALQQISPEEMSKPELDNLSDDQVEDLYQLLNIATDSRRGSM